MIFLEWRLTDNPLVFGVIVAVLMGAGYYLEGLLTGAERPEWVGLAIGLVWFSVVSTVLQFMRMMVMYKNLGDGEGVAPDQPDPEPVPLPASPRLLPNLGKVDLLYQSVTRSILYRDWPDGLAGDQVERVIDALLENGRATHDALNFLSRPNVARVKSFLHRQGWGDPENRTITINQSGREALTRLRSLTRR